MLVKVNPAYGGLFLYREGKGTVAATKDAPLFEFDDAKADKYIRDGVLVPATMDTATQAAKPAGDAADGWRDRAKALGIKYIGKKKDDVLRMIEEAERTDGEEPPVLDALLPE